MLHDKGSMIWELSTGQLVIWSTTYDSAVMTCELWCHMTMAIAEISSTRSARYKIGLVKNDKINATLDQMIFVRRAHGSPPGF